MKKVLSFFILALTLIIHAQEVDQSAEIDLLLLNEDYVKAVSLIESAIANDTLNAALYYKLGTAYQNTYRNDKALCNFEKAFKLDSSLTHKLALAKAYNNSGYVKKAKKIYIELCTNTVNYSAGINLAKILIDESDYPQAFNLYNTLFASDSSSSFLLKQMGFCLLKMDSLELSMKYYERALALNPSDAFANVQISTICFGLGRYDSAFTFVNKGLDIIPDEPDFNKLKAEILIKKKLYPDAKDIYTKLVESGDSTSTMLFKLGYCYYYMAENPDTFYNLEEHTRNFQNYFTALAFFEKSYTKENENPVNCYYAGLTADKTTQSEKSIFYFNESIKYSIPDYAANAYRYMGNNNQLIQKYSEAIECYRKAFFYDPDDKELLYYIASLFELLKDQKNAGKYFQEFIETYENKSYYLVEMAKHALKQMKKR